VNIKNMKDMFATLGAPLHNAVWSWGAVRAQDGAVFLRVWQDRMRMHDGSQFVQVHTPRRVLNARVRPGRRERLEHVDLIRRGAACYLIMLEARDQSARPRSVKSFNAAQVFRGGRLVELDGEWYIERLDSLSVEEAMSTAQNPHPPGAGKHRHRTRLRNSKILALKPD
jgi:hypothetical protein